MKKIFFLFLLTLPFGLYSQNWSLINHNYSYHYSENSSGLYSTTIKTDSISVNGGDTIFYLNRIITNCNSCPTTTSNYYLRYNQPSFLQRNVLKSNNTFVFLDTTSYVIHPNDNVGSSWTFDSINSISAQIISTNVSTIFGSTIDSVKYILLSNLDTIIVSKNFGIIQFQINNISPKYKLIGINSSSLNIGFTMPMFFDFYDFNVGDVFQYHEYFYAYGSIMQGNENYTKITILNKTIIGDTIKYGVHSNRKQWQLGSIFNPYNTTIIDNNGNIQYINSQNDLSNAYNNKFQVEAGGFENYVTAAKVSYEGSLLNTKSCSDNIIPQVPFFSIDTNSTDLLMGYAGYPVDAYNRELKMGLGQVSLEISFFEATYYKYLIGYIKNGVTTGTVYVDFVGTQDNYFSADVKAYPNPSKDNVTIEFNTINYNSEKTIVINDVSGRKIKEFHTKKEKLEIDISILEKGIYFFEIKENEFLLGTKKILKE